jgi:rod shape-determining protein MreD
LAEQSAQGWWVVVLSFFCAMLLNIVPMPEWMQWARPEWVALVLIYWVIAIPQRIGVVTAWLLGMLLDSIEGAVLGQNALSLSVVAYFSAILYQRLRMYAIWQQAMVVCILIAINQFIGQWVQNLGGSGAASLLFLLPALVSALLWPWVMLLLRHVRRHYRVN